MAIINVVDKFSKAEYIRQKAIYLRSGPTETAFMTYSEWVKTQQSETIITVLSEIQKILSTKFK